MFYDYNCKHCKKTVEVEKGMNDPAPDKCPKCGSVGTLERVFTNPAATIYGCGGFYDTNERKVGSR